MDFMHPVESLIPGAQGSVLAVLAETTAELNMRTLARLASISHAQASRVLPGLVELGVVERREVPPSSLFLLNRQNVAAQIVIDLSRSRTTTLDHMGQLAAELPTPPTSVIVFGSFARREADRLSDIDVLIIRPNDIDEEDHAWTSGVEQWRSNVRAFAGNHVEILEASSDQARKKLRGRSALWQDIKRDGVDVFGTTLTELQRATVA